MSRRAWIYFWIVSVLWGSSFLFIKVAVDELSPAVVVLARTALGALVLLPVALVRRAFTGLAGRKLALVALAAVDVAVPFLLIAYGEERISSSLAGILLAADPLFVALLALRFDRSERIGGWRLLGLGVGVVGVVVLLGLDVGGSGTELVGAAMVLAASLSFAAAALLYKRSFADADPVGVTTAMLLIGALAVAIPAGLSAPSAAPNADVIAALLMLGGPNTGLGFWLFYALIAVAGAGRASVITYMTPAVAVVLGIAVLGESFTGSTALGLVLILAGSYLAAAGPPRELDRSESARDRIG